MTKDRWIEWAENTAREKIKSAIYYISEGIRPERALEMVLKGSPLGTKYKEIVKAEVMHFAKY